MEQTRCTWCEDESLDEWIEPMCVWHMAEYEGETVAGAERRDATQYAEWADAYLA